MPRRYEEEIEEIIDRDERRARRNERIRSVKQRVRGQGPRPVLTSGNLMLAGLVLVIAALIVKSFFAILASLGALLFIIGYVMYFTRSRAPRHEKRWRGEVIDFQDSWSNRIRRFFNRRR